jgi:hypothetical protein
MLLLLEWTKTSFVPSAGVIKPASFVSLYHLIVPSSLAIVLVGGRKDSGLL